MIDMTNMGNEPIKVEDNPIKKRLWSIDSAPLDGQVVAGEVDRAQEEFLKTTEWAD